MALLLASLVVTGGLVSGALVLSTQSHRPSDPPTGVAKPQTTTVTKRDLADSQVLPGTLGFGADTKVKGTGSGLVTELPETGRTFKRGRQLFAVNDQPVVVFYGTTPLFRTLDKPTLHGKDVTMVAENLVALGYDIGAGSQAIGRRSTGGPDSAGDAYTPALSAAVKRWQKYIGMKATGTLGPGQIVVLPGRVRVNSIQAQLGDPADQQLMTVTHTDKTVSVQVGATAANGISTGQHVRIILPDASETAGIVSGVSQTVEGGGQGGNGQNTTPTLTITITPETTPALQKLTAAAVQVRFTTSTRKGVLTVPVGALVALQEGGYALQRTDGTFVGVRTGLFADGMVEVSGDGVTEGLRVETSS